MRILKQALIVVALLPVTAWADESFLPTDAAVDAALAEHPLYARAVAGLDRAKADERRLRAGPYEFEVSVGYVRRNVDLEQTYGEWEFGLSRPIRLPGKAALDRTAGRLGVASNENALEDARHQTALLLLDHWMIWLEAAAVARIDADIADAWKREEQAVGKRVELRQAAVLDQERVAVERASADALATASQGQAEMARASLMRMFEGLPVPPDAPEIADPVLPERSADQWFALIMDRSHEIRRAEVEVERTRALAQRASRDEVPDPRIGLTGFRERGGAEYGVGVAVSIPIGGRFRRAQTDMAVSDASASLADLMQVQRETGDAADRHILGMQAGIAAWRQAKAASESSASVLARTQRGYELGSKPLSDVLMAMRQDAALRRAEALARAKAQHALLRLQIDVHELWIVHDEAT